MRVPEEGLRINAVNDPLINRNDHITLNAKEEKEVERIHKVKHRIARPD